MSMAITQVLVCITDVAQKLVERNCLDFLWQTCIFASTNYKRLSTEACVGTMQILATRLLGVGFLSPNFFYSQF